MNSPTGLLPQNEDAAVSVPPDGLRRWEENLRQAAALLAENRQGRSLLR